MNDLLPELHRVISSKAQAGWKPNPAFSRLLRPDETLARIVGSNPMPRSELARKLWNYIGAHRLQDAANRRVINADETLSMLLGGMRTVNVFELTRAALNHIKK